MKKVTIEIDDNFDDVLTITVVGCDGHFTNVSTGSVDIQKYNKITFDHNGRMEVCHAED